MLNNEGFDCKFSNLLLVNEIRKEFRYFSEVVFKCMMFNKYEIIYSELKDS